jgi:hypothetical protein
MPSRRCPGSAGTAKARYGSAATTCSRISGTSCRGSTSRRSRPGATWRPRSPRCWSRGAAEYAALCRAPEVEEMLALWEDDDRRARRRLQELLNASGLEPPDNERPEGQSVEKPVGQQLGSAEERGHATARGKPDSEGIPWRTAISRRHVLKGQRRQHERCQGNARDDPEQWPPVVCGGLDAADHRTQRDGAEATDVHDHHNRAHLRGRITDDQRRDRRDEQEARRQALQRVSRDEHPRRGGRRREDRTDQQ